MNNPTPMQFPGSDNGQSTATGLPDAGNRPEAAVRVERLTRTYNLVEDGQLKSSQTLYRDLSLDVADGEFIAVVGDSGCGKSTLLHIIGMLDTISNRSYATVRDPESGKERRIPRVEGSGRVLVDGVDVTRLTGNARADFVNRNVGFIFQMHHLIPELTALQNVALPMRIGGCSRRQSRRRAQELLAEVGLGSHAGKRPGVLSGGEKQRVAIARALANGPKILLADEPTGSLHPEMKKGIMERFVALNHSRGVTIILVTHDVHSLEEPTGGLRVNRIISLDGKVGESGDEVTAQTPSPETLDGLRCAQPILRENKDL
jgi:ABC-type lipoprotein export system ATPase subunit